jgi:hypothetical protein
MKKAIIFILVVALILLAVPSVIFAAKPATNLAGAVKVAWNLSGAVMPVPPYGSLDIPGSDTASKLIVNRPNGNTVVTITGVMNGLTANTTYTVFISNGYTKYADTGWDVAGDWIISFEFEGPSYSHDMTLGPNANSGSGGYPVEGPPYEYPWTITSGSVSGNTIDFYAIYHDCAVEGAIMHVTGVIASDGQMSGDWTDNAWGLNRSGTWTSTSGNATKTHTGDTGWPGLFSTIQPFTFTTDGLGSGSWHINLKDADFTSTGTFNLSVWINVGATILISDVFQVTK